MVDSLQLMVYNLSQQSRVYDKHCTWPIVRNLRGEKKKKQAQECIKMNLVIGSLTSARRDAVIYPFRNRLSGKVRARGDPEVKPTEMFSSCSSCPCYLETKHVGGRKKPLSEIYDSSKDPRTYILAPKACKILSVMSTCKNMPLIIKYHVCMSVFVFHTCMSSW